MRFTRAEYEAYIASPAWEAKRQRALRKHGARCAACGNADPGLHVHHHTYDRFTRERMDDLVVLCKPCHRLVHRIHDEQRFRRGPTLTLTEVTYAFLRHDRAAAYSLAVMADHTPPVPPKPKRKDGKRAVSMNRADRKPAVPAKGVSPGTVRVVTALPQIAWCGRCRKLGHRLPRYGVIVQARKATRPCECICHR